MDLAFREVLASPATAERPAPRFVDPAAQVAFWERMYLGEGGFIAQGGSKLKFVRGRQGAGKTRLLQEVARRAQALGYLAVCVDAAEVAIQRIDGLYRELFKNVDVWQPVRRFAMQIAAQFGADPSSIPGGMSFMDWVAQQGRVVEVVRRDARGELESRLFRNPNLQRTFSFGLIAMAGDVLGVRPLDPEDRVALQNWIRGVPVLARERNRLNLREAIDRYSARLMLRSWLSFLRLAGYRGLYVGIDNLDAVLNSDPARGPKYTRLRRDDLYETIRELIDEVDSLEGLFLVMAGRVELFTDEKAGLRSYPALWMRIQNEVQVDASSGQVNRFADIVDLDRLWETIAPEGYLELGRRAYEGADAGSGELEPGAVAAIQEIVSRVLASPDMSVSPVQRVVHGVAEYRRRHHG